MNTSVALHPHRLVAEFAGMYACGILIGSFAPGNQVLYVAASALGIVLVKIGARYNAAPAQGRHSS